MRTTNVLAAALIVTAFTAADASQPAFPDAARAAAYAADNGLEGARPPVDCVNTRQITGNSGVAPDLIRFNAIGRRVYLNETEGCALRPGLALVSYRSTANLCRGQIVQVVDPFTGMGYGSCSLGAFVPYERPRRR